MAFLIALMVFICGQNLIASERPINLELKMGLPHIIGGTVQYDIFNNHTTISPYFDFAAASINADKTESSSTGLSTKSQVEKLKFRTIALGADLFFNSEGRGWYTGLNMNYLSLDYQSKYQYSGSFDFGLNPLTDGENYSYKQDVLALMTKIGYKWRWTYFHLGGEFGLGHTLNVSDEGKVNVYFNNGTLSTTEKETIFTSGVFPSILLKCGFHF